MVSQNDAIFFPHGNFCSDIGFAGVGQIGEFFERSAGFATEDVEEVHEKSE
jgi:hypothetical protein